MACSGTKFKLVKFVKMMSAIESIDSTRESVLNFDPLLSGFVLD